jgi:hypothetical protein
VDLENRQRKERFIAWPGPDDMQRARLAEGNVVFWSTSSILENWKRPNPDPRIFENHNASL